ncbi:hypothetical protein K376_05681 [Streptomyces sp. PsTaAH-130]|nr:hypothetical protein K376_05681 [Streptomyces sp. PsTaAH-130]
MPAAGAKGVGVSLGGVLAKGLMVRSARGFRSLVG